MKKITDKDVEALKAGKKVTKGFIHMQLDDKGRLNMWADINITDKYRDFEIDASKLFDHGILTEEYDSYWTSTQYNYEKAWLVTYNGNEFYPNDERKNNPSYAIRAISQLI